MSMKLVAIVCAAAFAVWYAAVGGRQIDEGHVRHLYEEYLAAFDKGDGKAVCEMFDDKVSGSFRSTAPSMRVNETITKSTACAAVDNFYLAKKKFEEISGEEMHTNLEFTINAIAISPDKKSATVDVLLEMRIGTERKSLLDMRSTQTDKVIRNFGSAKFIQSDGVVSFYY
jgi:hypothetical protein